MPLSKNILNYQDLIPVLDALQRVGGGTYEARDPQGQPSSGAAVYWMSRVWQLRKLQIEATGTSPYLGMSLFRECGCKKACDCRNGMIVVVDFSNRTRGPIRDHAGMIIPIGPISDIDIELPPLGLEEET